MSSLSGMAGSGRDDPLHAASAMLPPIVAGVMLRPFDVVCPPGGGSGDSNGGGFGLDGQPVDGAVALNESLRVELEYKELWDQFTELGTEMVITKSGRWVNYA